MRGEGDKGGVIIVAFARAGLGGGVICGDVMCGLWLAVREDCFLASRMLSVCAASAPSCSHIAARRRPGLASSAIQLLSRRSSLR